jgi:hypothetical protein
MRDNKWLKNRLLYLWQRYFSDIPILNKIIIKFGRPCKTRLGSIKPGRKYKTEHSIITINGLFIDPQIPDFIIDATIAHEFMHYGHGFASPHEKAYRHPHQGGVVNYDMKERGLGDILALQKKWLKQNWKNTLIKKRML